MNIAVWLPLQAIIVKYGFPFIEIWALLYQALYQVAVNKKSTVYSVLVDDWTAEWGTDWLIDWLIDWLLVMFTNYHG